MNIETKYDIGDSVYFKVSIAGEVGKPVKDYTLYLGLVTAVETRTVTNGSTVKYVIMISASKPVGKDWKEDVGEIRLMERDLYPTLKELMDSIGG